MLLLFCLSLFQPFGVEAQTPLLPKPRLEQPHTTKRYASDRVLVKFKKGQSKKDIETQVETREKERATFFGSIRQRTADTLLRFGKETPDKRLSAIKQVEQKVRVTLMTPSRATTAGISMGAL